MIADDVAVGVPAFVVDVDEPHAALDHPPRQQAGAGKRRLVGIDPVQVQRRLGSRCSGPSVPERRSASRRPFRRTAMRVAISGSPIVPSRRRLSDSTRSNVSRCSVASTPGGTATHSGSGRPGCAAGRRCKPWAKIRWTSWRPAADARAGGHHHEGRQVARLGSQSVNDPRAQARPSGLREAGVDEKSAPERG